MGRGGERSTGSIRRLSGERSTAPGSRRKDVFHLRDLLPRARGRSGGREKRGRGPRNKAGGWCPKLCFVWCFCCAECLFDSRFQCFEKKRTNHDILQLVYFVKASRKPLLLPACHCRVLHDSTRAWRDRFRGHLHRLGSSKFVLSSRARSVKTTNPGIFNDHWMGDGTCGVSVQRVRRNNVPNHETNSTNSGCWGCVGVKSLCHRLLPTTHW